MSPSPIARPRAVPSSAEGPPPLRSVAEVLHRATVGEAGTTFAYVVHEPPGSLSLGLWPVPHHVVHPADPLIGFVAPERWAAIGLCTSGRVRRGDDAERSGGVAASIRFTVLLGRDGEATSVLEEVDGTVQVLEEPPEGWAADALARVLRRPTPPPVETPAHWLEATWLDRLAAGLLPHPGRGRSWRWLADRHPLAGPGPTPSPGELAERTRSHAGGHSWARLRRFGAVAAEALLGPEPVHPPPPGQVIPVAHWFDDGSYARWLLRRLPPAELLLPDLLAVLGPERGHDLVAALSAVPATAVEGSTGRRPPP